MAEFDSLRRAMLLPSGARLTLCKTSCYHRKLIRNISRPYSRLWHDNSYFSARDEIIEQCNTMASSLSSKPPFIRGCSRSKHRLQSLKPPHPAFPHLPLLARHVQIQPQQSPSNPPHLMENTPHPSLETAHPTTHLSAHCTLICRASTCVSANRMKKCCVMTT